jgi:hypothetical protein
MTLNTSQIKLFTSKLTSITVNERDIINLNTVLSCLFHVTVQYVSITKPLAHQFDADNPAVMMQLLPSCSFKPALIKLPNVQHDTCSLHAIFHYVYNTPTAISRRFPDDAPLHRRDVAVILYVHLSILPSCC